MTVIASGLSANKPMCCAQGRYGELIIAQGGGVQPKRWTGSGLATNAGIAAPSAAPTVTLDTTKRFYVARADVYKPGAVYNTAPDVTFSTPSTPPAGFRSAKALAYLNQSVVGELAVTDGGKHYPSAPSISLSATHGTGAVLTAVLDGVPPPADAITHYEVIQGPPFDEETDYKPDRRTQWDAWGSVDIPVVNGSGTISRTIYVYHNACGLGTENLASFAEVALSLPYTVTGATGTGAIARVNFYGQQVASTKCVNEVGFYTLAWSYLVRSVTVHARGSGYAVDSSVRITIPPELTVDSDTGLITTTIPPTKNLIIEGYPPGHANNTSTPRFSIKRIDITNGGSGYVVAPEIKIISSSGFGAYASCRVTNGSVSQIALESGGGGYKLTPTVQAVSGGAEVCAVARPHLRGKYQCYYRYVDNTPVSSGGPIPSSLSPVREVDAGEGAQSMTWTASAAVAPDGRTLAVELWRTTGNQATTLYRVGTGTSLVDDLTDEEVRNPDRAGYAAMPIVLPNGELNANRFTPPPNNKAVVVRYQDRFWYGVDTSGSEPNSIYFSEVDEPESVPDVNELVLQQNARTSDVVTALVPFGSSMLVMQSRHAYSLSFSKQPLRDADVSPIAHRGCASQRCWDIYEGVCYALDQYGVYSITPQGEIKDISAPINDLIRTQLDWANSTWNFVIADAARKVLRVFVAFSEDGSTGYPTRAMCYSFSTGAWWIERYPHRISAAVALPLFNGDYRSVYGAEGGAFLLDEGHLDAARGAISTVTLTNKGSGYRTPPNVSVAGGVGARLQASLTTDGQVGGIWILHSGHGYTSGSLTISAPDDPAGVPATATFTATANDSNTAMFPVYRYKTGNRALPTDATSKSGGSAQARDISLLYRPQPSRCDIAARLYYNNSAHARPNAAYRNRGVGFVANTVDGASRLDMAAQITKTGYDSGVAKAVFANRSMDDIQSADRHVAVELLGARMTAQPVVIYAIDVYGTADQG